MKVTIELPKTVTISAGDAEAEFEWSKLPKGELENFVATAAVVGVAKAGNDSASGAKQYAEKNDDVSSVDEARQILIDKWIAARYESGEFGRVTGGGMSAVDRELVSMYRPIVKKFDEKAYKHAPAELERVAMVKEYIAGLSDAEREAAEKVAAKRIEIRKRQKEELEALDIPGVAVNAD